MEPAVVFLAAFGIFGSVCAENFYIAAPSVLRINSDVTLAIAVDGDSEALVNVYIQDFPGRVKNISQAVVTMRPELPEIIKIRLDAKDFPENFFKYPGFPKLVSLNAQFLNTHKEIVIPVSSQSGYIFIQTDQQIYTPKERVLFRILSLTEEALPSKEQFQLQIRNPDNLIVEEKLYNEFNRNGRVFASYSYRFPGDPVFGEWSATVRFGHNLEQNSTIRFMLQEYVSPTFTVELKTPDVILPNEREIKVEVTASYVYGKRVKGSVSFSLGVKSEHGTRPHYFTVVSPKELNEGQYTLRINTDYLKRHKDIGWFPEIDKSSLVVRVVVVEYGTGNKEEVIDSKAIFSKSPFIISFKRCVTDFKPGIPSSIEADITYVDGRPAEGILAKLTAVAVRGELLPVYSNTTISDATGRVFFEIQTELHHKTVRLLLEANDPNYGQNKARNTFKQFAHESPSYAYIAISRNRHVRIMPGDTHTIDFQLEPAELKNVYYLVVARGKILNIGRILPVAFKLQRVAIEVTDAMVPYFRVVIFTHYKSELIADSLKFEVDSQCNPSAEVNIDLNFLDEEPGSNGAVTISGAKDTNVELFSVEGALFKEGLLTKSKIFDTLVSHDLGCGPGGGLNVTDVLRNAGITLATNKYSPSRSLSCVEIKQRKREIEQNIKQKGDTLEKTAENYFEGVQYIDSEEDIESKMSERGGTMLGGTVGNDFDEFVDDEMGDIFEKETPVRRDFRRTWFYDNMIVGPDGSEDLYLSLPHTLTTWVIQAVSVSPEHGICVSEPRKIVSFKKVFLHLNLPYKAVRNEQVEIQATVFNYGNTVVGASVYLYGDKNLCSGAQPGQKSETKRVVVDVQSAASVAFPVIPLATGHITIKVVLLTTVGTDVIEKMLYVVPEGVTKEVNVSIRLDPTNLQRSRKNNITSPFYFDSVDTTTNIQITTVNLSIPEEFVPGTASCSITALGDSDIIGSFVETSIKNALELLVLKESLGSGKETIMTLASFVYAMRYLEAKENLKEDVLHEFIRRGYNNQVSFRKYDGSYADDQSKPTSTWLTAFVIKVFCRAKMLVDIDENIICSGVQWLIRNQEADGSYDEKHPIHELEIVGGVNGSTFMTAFTLITLQECECNNEGLVLAKTRAVTYLENHLGDMNTPLLVSIVAYALELSNSDSKHVAYEKLQSMAKYNEFKDWMYWSTDNSTQDIETAGYGLLTELLFHDVGKSSSIVNWLNEKELSTESFKSTQNTVVALQALTEYVIRTQTLSVNLVSNITSSNDRNFRRVVRLNKGNAHILQNFKVDRIGGRLFITTTGQGRGYLIVKLRYNVVQSVEDVCKFDLTVNVTEPKTNYSDLSLTGVNRGRTDLLGNVGRRNRNENGDANSNFKLNITLCVRYLGDVEAGLSIVDVGVFSGFEPVAEELNQLERDPTHLINMFEKSSRGVVFYLDKVPLEKYCFSFHVIRQYIVERVPTSVIRVYDYYNTDAICTKMYSPENNTHLIRTICEGSVCHCAEGGCPPMKPFSEFQSLSYGKTRYEMLYKFCSDYDYAWKGRLYGRIREEGGFNIISFIIDEVIKEGIESDHDLNGEERTLMALNNCQTARLFEGATYLILGKDGPVYENENNERRVRYILDQTSIVFLWSNRIAESPNKQIQRTLNRVTKEVKDHGCED